MSFYDGSSYLPYLQFDTSESEVLLSQVSELADGSRLATSAAPTTDAMLANKKYVDDNAGGTSYWKKAAALITPLTDGDSMAVVDSGANEIYLGIQNSQAAWQIQNDTTGKLIIHNTTTGYDHMTFNDVSGTDAVIINPGWQNIDTSIYGMIGSIFFHNAGQQKTFHKGHQIFNENAGNYDFTNLKDDGTIAIGYDAGIDQLDLGGSVVMPDLPVGSTEAAAGTNGLWVTSGHATLPDGVVMRTAP